MITQSLNGAWQMYCAGSQERIPAKVPGSVYADLLRNGKMEDPFWRDNELKALKLMENDYIYERAFTVDQSLLECGSVFLRCEGLDTLAEVEINGEPAFSADNMHRIWEWEIKAMLKRGENRISIRFSSPTRYIREAYRTNRADGSEDAMTGFPNLRKTHCMFGWDWGPRLPDMGIWRDISILGVQAARLTSVYVRQEHDREHNFVKLHFPMSICGKSSSLQTRISVTEPGGRHWETQPDRPGRKEIVIQDPMLWWPNGYGSQPLYQVKVELVSTADGSVLDTWERRIGLRTMTMHIEKDEWGESFAHEVNGVQIFAMGADYIPEDNLFSRITPERTRRLLEDCRDAHFNAVRVWGGGYYPDDFFYDICDELGLIVWQDMMFACAVYNLTADFERNIAQEIEDNVKRLRHHPSLGLWCGNNEMEMFVDQGNWVSSPRQKADYIKMYEYVIPKVLEQHDPDTFYWPASPSSGGSFDEPNSPDRGDVHYWEVWHGNKPFTDYRNYYFRYASEFGFQSFPSIKTIESFTLPEDRNVFSYIMEKHQRNNAANGKIMNYMAQTFLYPNSFEILLYASQLLQAEAIRYGVEHWRRNRGRCMGAIYWQLNDCWPVASWASIDYFGRWKALHYSAKRFFAPILLSCCEEGILTQDTNVNAEPYEVKRSGTLCVTNETREPFAGTVRWALRKNTAEIIRQGEFQIETEPLSSQWLPTLDFADGDLYEDYMSFSLTDGGNSPVSSGSVIFCPPKHFRFLDPNLSAVENGDGTITVRACAYARSVELDYQEGDAVFSDNYFDMDGGEKTIRILRGGGKGLRVRSVYDIR